MNMDPSIHIKETSLAPSSPTGPPSVTKPSLAHEVIAPRDQDVEMEGIHPEQASASDHAVSKSESNTTISHSSEEDDDLELSSPSSGSDDDDDGDEDDGDEEEEDEEDEEADDDNEGGDLVRAGRSKQDGEEEGEDEEEDEDEDEEDGDEDDAFSIQREGGDYSEICRWKDCGKILSSVEELVLHVSDEHIGWKKDSYTCEWQGCTRKANAQTTRFALISHMRSHTKHKPYDCPVPECDKSFSRSDAMAKHLKCQHSDVPERFTGRKSRGRYTMKNPAASSTLLRRNGHGAGSDIEQDRSTGGVSKKRRHGSPSSSTSLLLQQKPVKIRKVGRLDSDFSNQSDSFQRNYRRNHTDMAILRLLNNRKGKHNRHHQDSNDESHEEQGEGPEDSDAEDSDFAHDNGQTPKVRYGILKAKFRYIFNERELLESEYEDLKRKLSRLKVERELLIDALSASKEEYQDPALEDFEDSE
ncbi:hypothetical protein BG005_011262 [Podila minutissima]|nr:hypothetical protein BG005_011262 [Podila minutissima]